MAENEDKRIVCEECGQRDAACTMVVMMGVKAVHRKLCHECMAKTSMSIATGNLGGVLGAILAAARNAVQQPEAPQLQQQEDQDTLPEMPGEAAVCPECGTTYEAFRKSHCLGCAACANAFRQTLLEALRQSGAGAVHTGRRPLSSPEAIGHRARRVTLQRQLDEAVAREDYEAAAGLRDELRMMDMQEGHEDE